MRPRLQDAVEWANNHIWANDRIAQFCIGRRLVPMKRLSVSWLPRPTLGTALIVLATLALTGCPGFGDKTLAELSDLQDEITYEAHIKPILAAKCTTCHSDPPVAGAPNAFVTYETAKAAGDRIRVRAVIEKNMPLGAPLPDDEIALIDTWVQSGMPRGTPPSEDEGEDAPSEPDATPEDRDADTEEDQSDDLVGEIEATWSCSRYYVLSTPPPPAPETRQFHC